MPGHRGTGRALSWEQQRGLAWVLVRNWDSCVWGLPLSGGPRSLSGEGAAGARPPGGRDYIPPSHASSFRSAVYCKLKKEQGPQWLSCHEPVACPSLRLAADVAPKPGGFTDSTTFPQLKSVCLPHLIFCNELKLETYKNL